MDYDYQLFFGHLRFELKFGLSVVCPLTINAMNKISRPTKIKKRENFFDDNLPKRRTRIFVDF